MRGELLDQLSLKQKTEFVLNILSFTDWSRWPPVELEKLIDHLEEMNDKQHEQNRIVLSYNPILCICLACIHLKSIGSSISLFKHRNDGIASGLLDLGDCIVSDMEKGSVRRIFMDLDFKNRTVLHLITYNGFAPLMKDSKVTMLLDKLW